MEKLSLPVEEFTTPNPITAPETSTVDELNRIMNEYGIRHIPITKKGRVVGIVSDRDLRVVAGMNIKDKSSIRAQDIMAADPVTVSSESTIDEVAFEMSEKKIGSVIVNEGDDLLGIFTVTDALNALIEITRSMQGKK